MTCDPLAYTGGGQISLLLMLAIGCVLAGALLLLMTRRRGRGVTLVLLLVVGGGALLVTAATPTPAMADVCPTAEGVAPNDPPAANVPPVNVPTDNSLTITQTSVMVGLAPGIAPVAITGVVSNNGTDSTDITAIEVAITGVITDPNSAPGTCDPSDYVLLNPRMPVGQTLGPGGSTPFAGASIGFSNKVVNQDTCKGATVVLLYTANPADNRQGPP
jgi:hypothetical protein